MIKYKITSVESIQYKAAVSITGAIRRTSKEKLLEKLDLEPTGNTGGGTENFAAFIKLWKTNPQNIFLI